jgi:serine/threonine-protein kinase
MASGPAPASLHFDAVPDWSAVAADPEEYRRILNQRIAFFGAVLSILSVAFLIINVVVIVGVVQPYGGPTLAELAVDTSAHLLAVALAGTQWLLCRRAGRSLEEARLVDAIGLVGMLATYGVQASSGQVSFANGIVASHITLAVVVTRAIIVPSSPKRTLVVSLLSCVPALIATWYVSGQQPDLAQAPELRVVGVGYIGAWCLVTVVVSVLASRTIFGLSQRVREATELGQYTLEEKIGEGGMGAVYRARHALLRRPTAIKVLSIEATGMALARFEREVQLTSALTHPNTIAVYDFGRTPEGRFYYAMEYLSGITLEDLVLHDGPQTVARTVHLLEQVAGALAEAHEVPLIHRDIKPANLMLCVRGSIHDFVKVLDFGLAKEVQRGEGPSVSTAGTLLGTPLYISPEAILGVAEVDARADLYALGAVGYWLLAGRPPFDGVSVIEICGKHLHAAPTPIADAAPVKVPPALASLLMRCLAKDRDQRPASARAFLEELRRSDAEPWREGDARLWWAEAAPEVIGKIAEARAERRGAAAPSARHISATLAVDMAARAPRP